MKNDLWKHDISENGGGTGFGLETLVILPNFQRIFKIEFSDKMHSESGKMISI